MMETFILRYSSFHLQVGRLIVELSSNINVGSTCTHGTSSYQAALHQLVWVIPHDLPVLTGAGLSLVRIHHQILWPEWRN